MQDEPIDLCLVIPTGQAPGRINIRASSSSNLLQTYKKRIDALQTLRVTNIEAYTGALG